MLKDVYKYKLILLVFLQAQTLFSQTEKIKVQKEDAIYFYQIGQKSDTISIDKNDLFYLKFSGSFKCNARIEVVNGRLYKTKNDTVFQLKKATNLQYEHYFMDSVFVANKPDPKGQSRKCNKFVTHINGAKEGDGKTITIQIYNLNTKETLLNNTFYHR